MTASLHTNKLPRASKTGKSKRGQLPARFRDRAGLLEDDFGPVTEDEMITEKQARFDLASSIPGYAAWFRANRPDEYAEWLKTGASDRIMTSTSTQCTATLESGLKHEIRGILAASERLCLPAPKVEAVVTCDLTALVKVYEAREELAELAWIAFGELLDACVADYITAIAFITVYGVDLFWFEAVDTNGLTVKATEWRYTFYGPLPLLTEHQSKLAALGTKASQIYRDLKPSEALNTRYQWKHGELIETPRKVA